MVISSFKPKCDKKLKFNVTPVTLDDKHQQHLDTFRNNHIKVIPELKEKVKSLKNRYSGTKNIEARLEITDKIKSFKNKIKALVRKEKEYMLDNSNIIFLPTSIWIVIPN